MAKRMYLIGRVIMADGDGGGIMDKIASTAEQRSALQIAFYNSVFFVLLGIALCALFALYNMLYMFLSPMMWAVLVGTVLFPFKKKVTEIMKGGLQGLQDSDTSFVVGVLKFPFNTFNCIAEYAFSVATSQTGVIVTVSYLLLKILTYERTFMYVIGWMGRVYEGLDSFILFFTRNWVLPVVILYAAAYSSWIFLQSTSINKKFARTFSLPIWIYGLSIVSMYFGPFRAAVFGAAAIVLALISAGVIGAEESTPDSSKVEENDETKEVSNGLESTAPVEEVSSPLAENEVVSIDGALSGDSLISSIFGLCALLWVVRHDSSLIVLVIFLGFAVLKRIADSVGILSSASKLRDSVWENVYPSVERVLHITVAGPLRQFVKMLFTSDQMIITTLIDKMDLLSSLVVMILLAFSALFGLIFIGFQLHGETVHLLRLTSNVISSRPDWLGAAMNYTEDQLEENNIDIDNYVEQAYQQGRTWLATQARALADGEDQDRADMLENQVKQIVDNVYKMWEERNAAYTEDATTAVARGDWMSQLKGVTDIHALKEELTLIVKENLDTLMGVAQSVWAIVAVNISFLSSLLAAFAGIILGFGMDILNFLIEIIVFLTMVYYLLSASTNRWLPLEWASHLTSVVPKSSSSAANTEVSVAMERAIFGVFVLSAKMSVFYGLYTYFVHSLFDLNIVFVPCMLAAIFAAIPILAPYTVCIFGVFELWLVRGESAAALVFALMSFAPLMFADATFYREVKTSHPYVTGLSIIGGMYWLGLQGAIIGPIILCSFLVMVNVYMQFVNPEPVPLKQKTI